MMMDMDEIRKGKLKLRWMDSVGKCRIERKVTVGRGDAKIGLYRGNLSGASTPHRSG